ncbi:phage holin, LLH family [Anaerovoracaceae bacterium 41-7]
MKEIFIDAFISYLPELIGLFFLVLSSIVTKKVLPLVKIKLSQSQLEEISVWTEVLVESAQRLDKSGKLNGITKKEYVMQRLMEHVESLNYNFTDAQLDDIRRSAVLALENIEKIATDTKADLIDSDGGVA